MRQDSKTFINRIAYGVWVNDFRSEPITGEDWPAVMIDSRTRQDFTAMARFLKAAGYTALDVFGLLTNHDWPTDVSRVITPDRKGSVEELIAAVHAEDIKVIYGLGVYSWGFDSIIRADEQVRGTNPSAMCGSRPRSRQMMEKVIDFILDGFQLDGIHLEVADQGRCWCAACREMSDIQYYCRLNQETARYIRDRRQDMTLLVNTSGYLPWGDFFQPQDYPHLLEMGKVIDVFIDGGNHGLFLHERERPQFLSRFPSEYGTSGGFWVYPPQRWDRLRWFLPHFKRSAAHLKQLHQDGSRSCELYLGPLVNPATELTLLSNGILLGDIGRTVEDVLEEAVDRLYKPRGNEARRAVVELFLLCEEAFFSSWSPQRRNGIPAQFSDGIQGLFGWSKRTPERATPGELFLEPLFGRTPGFPAYLAVHMAPEGRNAYENKLRDALRRASRLGSLFNDGGRIQRIRTCLESVISDLRTVRQAEADG